MKIFWDIMGIWHTFAVPSAAYLFKWTPFILFVHMELSNCIEVSRIAHSLVVDCIATLNLHLGTLRSSSPFHTWLSSCHSLIIWVRCLTRACISLSFFCRTLDTYFKILPASPFTPNFKSLGSQSSLSKCIFVGVSWSADLYLTSSETACEYPNQ